VEKFDESTDDTIASAKEIKIQANLVDAALFVFVGGRKLLRISVEFQHKQQLAGRQDFCAGISDLRAGVSGFNRVAGDQSGTRRDKGQRGNAMTEPKRLRVIPIVITMVVALVLGMGSFYGCDRTFMSHRWQRLNVIFFWSFLVFAVCFLGSLVWLLVVLVLNYIRRPKDGL